MENIMVGARMRIWALPLALSSIGACNFSPSGVSATDAGSTSDAGLTINLCESGDLALCLEFEGNTDDSSIAANNATSSDVTYVVGRTGMAIRVDEVSSISILESDSLDLPALTIEGWVRPLVDNGNRQAIFDNDNQYALRIASDRSLDCVSVLGQSNGRNATGGIVSVNSWTHVACVHDPLVGLQVFVNAAPVGSDNLSPAPVADRGNSGSTVASDNNTQHFIGDIDTLRIWNRALSTGDLAQIIQTQ